MQMPRVFHHQLLFCINVLFFNFPKTLHNSLQSRTSGFQEFTPGIPIFPDKNPCLSFHVDLVHLFQTPLVQLSFRGGKSKVPAGKLQSHSIE